MFLLEITLDTITIYGGFCTINKSHRIGMMMWLLWRHVDNVWHSSSVSVILFLMVYAHFKEKPSAVIKLFFIFDVTVLHKILLILIFKIVHTQTVKCFAYFVHRHAIMLVFYLYIKLAIYTFYSWTIILEITYINFN